jgi:hypothetical protein
MNAKQIDRDLTAEMGGKSHDALALDQLLVKRASVPKSAR